MPDCGVPGGAGRASGVPMLALRQGDGQGRDLQEAFSGSGGPIGTET